MDGLEGLNIGSFGETQEGHSLFNSDADFDLLEHWQRTDTIASEPGSEH